MLWSLPLLLVLVGSSRRRRQQVRAALLNWRELRWLALSGLIVSFNWGIYIWAVANARVIEASMGYFLTPLLNVLAGMLVFGERLDRTRITALACAATGVAYLIASTGIVPWVSLLVGGSFAAYGLLRKRMATNAIPGLFIEILLLLPFTLGAILWLQAAGEAAFLNRDGWTDLWLVLAGSVTVAPLAFFTACTRLLPMTTVGILFYVTPSLQFLCGWLWLGEALHRDRLIGFVGIWIGLAIFTWSLLRPDRAQPRAS